MTMGTRVVREPTCFDQCAGPVAGLRLQAVAPDQRRRADPRAFGIVGGQKPGFDRIRRPRIVRRSRRGQGTRLFGCGLDPQRTGLKARLGAGAHGRDEQGGDGDENGCLHGLGKPLRSSAVPGGLANSYLDVDVNVGFVARTLESVLFGD